MKPLRNFSEEELADRHTRHLHNLSLFQRITAVLVLSTAAVIVILPFLYMLSVSFKKPAEMGNNQLIPPVLRNLGEDRVWIEVTLDGRRAIQLYNLDQVPVLPGSSAAYTPWPSAQPLPNHVVYATRESQEKVDRASEKVLVVLDISNRNGEFDKADYASVYLPSETSGTWISVEGRVVPRSFTGIAGRLFANYSKLLDIKKLQDGNWVDWLRTGYPRWYFNSLLVAISSVFIGVFFDSLAAFGFAKFNFPFKKSLFALLLATLMIPYPVTLVPTFFIFAELGLYNTYLALIIPGIVSAFGIFLVRQYLQSIPDDMLDAGRVDGANDFQIYWHIVVPAARPVLAALAIFRFIYQWNAYLFPLVLTNRDSMKTVQLGIATMEDMHGVVDYGMQMAASTMAVIPIIILYAFMQKHFIAGITLGSSKG